MAKRPITHQKRKNTNRKNRTRRAVKASAVSMAGLLAGGLALAPQAVVASAAQRVAENVLLAAAPSIIFIDGHDYPNGSTRMAGELQGQYQYQPCTAPCTHLTTPASGTALVFINDTSVYPGTYGPIDGPFAPSGEQSINDGQAAIDQQIHQQLAAGNTPVTVVGYSEGAVAASHEVPQWTPSDPVSFVLIGNPERPNGGILARLPADTYLPLFGLRGGSATSANGAPVVMVTRQYDGIADAPAYPINLLADANAFLGFYYLHGDYYSVDPNAPGNVVTTSPNGNMTDILVPAAPGDLPLFMPLAQAGVPRPILVALDPAARAIIDTGYARTSDPSQQVRFALVPPPSAWPGDAQMIVLGVITTAQLLPGALFASTPGAPGLPVPLPLQAIPQAPPPSPVTDLPVNPPQPPTQLVSQTQPKPQAQQMFVGQQPNGPATAAGPQAIPAPTAVPTDVSPARPPTNQPMSTPTAKPATVSTDPGNQVTAPPSLTGSNPLHAALSSVSHAIGSVTGSSTGNPLTSSTASRTPSDSGGAAPAQGSS